MRHTHTLSLALAVALALIACNREDTPTLYPVEVDGEHGFIDASGKLVVANGAEETERLRDLLRRGTENPSGSSPMKGRPGRKPIA